MDRLHPREPDRVELANLPTPLAPLKRLSADLGERQILMKRDDLCGIEFTGNKVRKLEYLLADALVQGCDTLITMGAAQSNHCRATAAAGARLGMHVRLILRSPEPAPANVGNLLLDRLFGAEVSLHHPDEYNGRRTQLIEQVISEQKSAGRKPYFINVGGSSAMGCWGYIRAMAELAQQIDQRLEYDLFVPLSSAGTFSGVLLGREMLQLTNVRVIGVLVSDDIACFHKKVPELMREAAARFDLAPPPSMDEVVLLDQFIGEGYGVATAPGLAAMRLLGRREGVILDPVYTAKAFAGMLDSIRRGTMNRTPIFLHTGGVFGMLARADLITP